MRLNSIVAVPFVTILAAGTSRADFKYTQQSKITGGTLVGVTKTLGVEEFRKNSLKMERMPLVEYSSFGMAANSQTGQSGSNQSGRQSDPQQQTSSASNDSTPTNPKDAITKSLGGLCKKKHQQQQQSDGPNASSAPPPASPPRSMMDVTTQVTSYSKDSLDASLFDVPSGYTEMQADAGGK